MKLLYLKGDFANLKVIFLKFSIKHIKIEPRHEESWDASETESIDEQTDILFTAFDLNVADEPPTRLMISLRNILLYLTDGGNFRHRGWRHVCGTDQTVY